jgi:RND family efflux transporter MFP subunit
LDSLRIDRDSAPAQRRGWLTPLIFLAVAAVGVGLWFWRQMPRPAEVRTVPVRALNAEQGASRTLLNASGYVEARRAATVSSKVTGKVVEVLIEEGMKVDAGQVLARLDDSNIKESLLIAEAQLESARKVVDETRPNLRFASAEKKRFTDLVATQAASQSDYNRAETQAQALEATLARQESDVKVAERQVSSWKQQMDDNIIRAPFAGVITTKDSQPGEMISPVSAGGGFTRTGICTIVDMSSLEIEVDVSESYINRVQSDQRVEATLDAYGDWRIPAKVIAIIPAADRQKATVKVRIGFERLDPRILPDMGVKVAFLSVAEEKSTTPQRQFIVPTAAVQKVDGREVVWVVKDRKVERRAVAVAQVTGDEATLSAGLFAGETVVIQTSQALSDGVKVTVSDSTP